MASRKPAIRAEKFEKYQLYELSVQSPDEHVAWYATIHRELTGRDARDFREDFCGTFQLSREWVTQAPGRRALGLDLDPEPLAYGKRTHWAALTPDQRRRLQVRRQNVLVPTRRKFDLINASNFSFCVFQRRLDLVRYFTACRRSLRKGGILLVDLAGGPGMIESQRESRTLRLPDGRRFRYIWHQKEFDPIRRRGLFAIHFKLPDGGEWKDAFTYDWRLWTIPEIREAMEEAGFRTSRVYWETTHRGEGTGEYVVSETGDNAYAWVAYIAGLTA